MVKREQQLFQRVTQLGEVVQARCELQKNFLVPNFIAHFTPNKTGPDKWVLYKYRCLLDELKLSLVAEASGKEKEQRLYLVVEILKERK